MKHVVMFSGGTGSWMTAKRVAEKHGAADLFLVFADVKGNTDSPHAGEDEDTYRFIKEAAANVGGELVWQAQFELLLREHPDRYAYHEAKEQELREYLGKEVTILRRREHGVPVPITLQRFREELERQPAMFDALDFGGCGCFVDDPEAAS